MNDLRPHFHLLPFARRMALPANERVLDRLMDLLLDADEVLHMLRAGDTEGLRWIEPHVRRVYDEVDEMMRRLCD